MNSSQKQEAQEAASQLVKDFLDWVKKQGSTGILYRGLADKRWEVSSSLYRRLLDGKCVDEESQTDVEIYQIHREANEKIIKGAKHQGYHREFGVLLNTLQTFAKLQHNGAATGLIDFTRNPLVALWFACKKIKGEETDENAQCRVIAINSGNDNVYQVIPEDVDKTTDELFEGKTIWIWQPPKQNNRIVSQHSEFVLGKPLIKIYNEFLIPSNLKESILAELAQYDISEKHLFCDFDGYTRIYAFDRPYNCEPTYATDAKTAAQSGDDEEAIKLYGRAIKNDEKNQTLYNERGLAKDKLGDFKGAIIDFDEALKLNDEYVDAYNNRGIAKHKLGDFKGAIIDFDKALELNPEYADAYFNRSGAKYKLGDFKGAIIDCNEALKLNDEYVDAYFNRGIAKDKLGDFEGAIIDFDKALELNPEYANTYFNRGIAKHKLGEFKGAIIDYDKALELNPEYANAYNNRGIAKHKLGEFKGAIIDYDKALELNPEYVDAYYNRGIAKHKLGNFKGAIIDYDKALELNPEYVDAYNNRGSAKDKLGDSKDAIIDYEEALKLNDEYATAYFNRGIAKYKLGDPKGALSDFKQANELDPRIKIPELSFDD